MPFKWWKLSINQWPSSYTKLTRGCDVEPHYFYADGPAYVMASLRASKELSLSGMRLPIFAELHGNPYLQKATLVFGLSIILF